MVNWNRKNPDSDFGGIFFSFEKEFVFNSFVWFGKNVFLPLEAVNIDGFFVGKDDLFQIIRLDSIADNFSGFFRRVIKLNAEESVIAGFIEINNFGAGKVGVVSRDVRNLNGIARFVGFGAVRKIGQLGCWRYQIKGSK